MSSTSNKTDERIQTTRQELVRRARDAGLPQSLLEPILKHVVPAFVEANRIADKNQTSQIRTARWVYILSFFAICVVIVQYMFFEDYYKIVLAEVFAIVAAYILIFHETRRRFRQEWLTHRYRAEMLRMLMYTPLLRTPRGRAQELIHGNSLTRQTEQIDPVLLDHYSMHELTRCEAGPEYDSALAKFLRDSWLAGQIKHHHKTAEENHHWAHRTHMIINVLVIMIILAAGLHAWHPFKWYEVFGGPKGWDLTVLITLLFPALVVGLHGYAQTRDWERTAGRAQAMHRRLTRISSMIKDATPRLILDNIIDDAEETIVRELAEWHEYTPEGPKHAG